MAANWFDWFFSMSATLIPAPVVSSGIGQMVVLGPDGASPISGQIASYTTAAEIAAALAATNIDAQTAADLTAALAQDLRLARVYVATYSGAETIDDAMDRAVAYPIDVGCWAVVSRVSTVIETAAGWVTADTNRRGRYLLGVQTDDSDVLAGSPPATLDACEIGECALFYAADADSTMAAWCGRVTAFPLVNGRSAAVNCRIQGEPVAVVTQAQLLTLTDDSNALALVQRSQLGTGASERVVAGVNSYGGTGLSPMLTLIYLGRRLREAVIAGMTPYQIRGQALRADTSGEAVVDGWLSAVLGELSPLFTPGSITEDGVDIGLPDGYRLTTVAASGAIVATITVLVGREARSLSIGVEAQEI